MSRSKAVMHAVPLLATKDESGKYHFEPESDLWSHSAQELMFHKAAHRMRKEDFHLVEFVLDDQTGEGLRFPSSPHDAMWVMPVEDQSRPVCPDKDSISDYSVMEPICVCDGGKRLIVRNDNPRQENWAFTLNVVRAGDNDSDPDTYVSWDPVGNNQNGGA